MSVPALIDDPIDNFDVVDVPLTFKVVIFAVVEVDVGIVASPLELINHDEAELRRNVYKAKNGTVVVIQVISST
jgi:hypothetical protein